MCRDGIVGAPLIYPFTHQRHHGQDRIRGPPTLFTRPPTTGPSFTLLFSSLFRRFFFPPHLVLHLPRPALPSTFLSLPLASSPSLPTLVSLSLSLCTPSDVIRDACSRSLSLDLGHDQPGRCAPIYSSLHNPRAQLPSSTSKTNRGEGGRRGRERRG